MKQMIFRNAKIITRDSVVENKALLVEEGKIKGLLPEAEMNDYKTAEMINCNGKYLSPGFVDIHCHGGGDADFMDGTKESVLQAARMHLKHGTTSIAPTSLTCSDEELFAFFRAYRAAREVKENMPNLIGIHLEGPYFNASQAGAQPPQYLVTPQKAHFQRIIEEGQGDILRWSVAVELDGAMELGDMMKEHGIYGSIGHSDAQLPKVEEAMKHGYTQLTHLYSAMSTIVRELGHRKLGIVEAAYLYEELDAEIIADGIHLPPELLKLIVKCKSLDHLCLVTDGMRGAGMPEGRSLLGSRANGIEVIIKDGIANMPDFTSFAGSVATTDRLVRTMVQKAGLPLWQAVKLASYNPARFVGLEDVCGSIAEGLYADLLIFDEDINVEAVYVRGVKTEG